MRKLYLLLLLAAPLFAVAQSNYKKGLIVNLQGDTVHGFIDYKEWVRNPKDINFKTDPNASKKLLGTADISYFAVDGFEYYKRYAVSISQDGVELSNAPAALDNTVKTDTVFLKILQAGKNVTLYRYTDALKTRFYIKDIAMDVPEELSYKVYQNQDNSGLTTRNFYYQQLNQFAEKYNANTPALTDAIKKTNYTESDLLSIISKINGNGGKQLTGQAAGRSGGRFFAGAAFYATKLKYGPDSDFPIAKGTTSNVPKLTLGYDESLNPNVGRVIIRGELSLDQTNYTVTNIDHNSHDGSLRTVKQELKQLTIGVAPQVIYNIYNTSALKIFADVGVSINISSYPTNIYSDSDAIHPKPVSGYILMKQAWITIPLKAGVVVSSRVEIYGTYFPSSAISNETTNAISLNSYQVGFNYLFGK